MSALTPIPTARRPELVFHPLGDRGEYVVKDPGAGEYFKLGAEGHFLLTRLDGTQTGEAIRAAFAERFGEPLSEEDLETFVELARKQGFLQRTSGGSQSRPEPEPEPDLSPGSGSGSGSGRWSLGNQSLLAWRCRFFDPDRLFTFLEPRLWFFWTRWFLLFSAVCIVAAVALVWLNRQELASSFTGALRWQTAVLVWLTLFAVTMFHESAHGLTCKHYGGEVHEIGFLLLLFMPCFYCNVSDAWLFKEKSKRLWVTFAGGYFELFLWALAVLVWRLTLPGGLLHYLAFVVATVCGVQTLFNFNPLIKLDGYYLLSDWLEIPNLQQRAWGQVKGWLRWLLWGAACPAAEPRRRFLLSYGMLSLLFSLVFLVLMLLAFSRFLGSRWGLVGFVIAGLLGMVMLRGLCRGLVLGEVRKMILSRHKRTAVWLLLLGAVAAALYFIEIEDRASGSFQVRPVTRAELRAPLSGFLREIHVEEGDRVSAGAPIVRFEIPDLASRLRQKRAEEREAQAMLSLLEAGPRYEEIEEQRQRVERMKTWRDLAKKDLGHARQALQEELTRLDQQIAQNRAELDAARDAFERAEDLRTRGAISVQEYREAERRLRVAQTQLAQALSQKRHRQALGTREAIAGLDAEAELARREKDLADAQSTLTLLEAGTRPDQIEAGRAHLARLQEEADYLETLGTKLLVSSPVAGVVTTPRLKEKIGQYVREGELICQVEEPAVLEAEITITEQEVARVRPGQVVELKSRALPLERLAAQVDRIAPTAGHSDAQSTVLVYCRLEEPAAELRPGMTGHARIYNGRRPIGAILLKWALSYLRTEFWW
jgi:multidrug efflux pump subunit AcrA (membrane-fusion protein)